MWAYCYKLFQKPLFAGTKTISSECHIASGHNVNLSRKRAPHPHIGAQSPHSAHSTVLLPPIPTVPASYCLNQTASVRELPGECSSTPSAAREQSHNHWERALALHRDAGTCSSDRHMAAILTWSAPEFWYLLLLWLSKLSANITIQQKKILKNLSKETPHTLPWSSSEGEKTNRAKELLFIRLRCVF